MRLIGKKIPTVSMERIVSKRMGVSPNAAGMCENNWGQGVAYQRKWIYLDPKLLKHPNQLLPLMVNRRLRN
ncbi:MAG: hypothetical protein ACXW3L_04360 [Limisphaerales bacterium]